MHAHHADTSAFRAGEGRTPTTKNQIFYTPKFVELTKVNIRRAPAGGPLVADDRSRAWRPRQRSQVHVSEPGGVGVHRTLFLRQKGV